MKVIGICGNYGNEQTEVMPEVYLMSDSSLLKDNKPFFIPDFAEQFCFSHTLVVHICRLGKNIARKFAHRYYDKLTVGLMVEAMNMMDGCCQVPGALRYAFDGAAIIGDFIDVAELPADINYEVNVNGIAGLSGSTAMLQHGIDELIEYVSRYMTLKIGDYIFVSQSPERVPLKINNNITAALDGKEVLRMKIK